MNGAVRDPRAPQVSSGSPRAPSTGFSTALRLEACRQLAALTLAHATALTWPCPQLHATATVTAQHSVPSPGRSPSRTNPTRSALHLALFSRRPSSAGTLLQPRRAEGGVGFWVINPSCRPLQMLIDSILKASPTCWHGQPPTRKPAGRPWTCLSFHPAPPEEPGHTTPTPHPLSPLHSQEDQPTLTSVWLNHRTQKSAGGAHFPWHGGKQSPSGEQTFEMHKNSMKISVGRERPRPRVSTMRQDVPCKSSAARPHPFSSTCHVTVNQPPRQPSGPQPPHTKARELGPGSETPGAPVPSGGQQVQRRGHTVTSSPQRPSGRPEQAGTEGEPRCGRAGPRARPRSP